MTEQEKRIEEMAQCKKCFARCYGLDGKREKQYVVDYYHRHCERWIVAKELVDLGYRKADEVRKETEKEIFSRIYKEIDSLLFQKSKTTKSREEFGACKQLSEIKEIILEIAKEFGV